MVLDQILHIDLYRSKSETEKKLLLYDVPVKPEFLPSVVSSPTYGKFITCRKISKDGYIRTGIFDVGNDLDLCIPSLFNHVIDLCKTDSLGNVFPTFDLAREYIQESSGMSSQPHAMIVHPSNEEKYKAVFKGKLFVSDVKYSVLLSRPDFVGLYTMFLGGYGSLILHNIQLGMAFTDVELSE